MVGRNSGFCSGHTRFLKNSGTFFLFPLDFSFLPPPPSFLRWPLRSGPQNAEGKRYIKVYIANAAGAGCHTSVGLISEGRR